MITTEWMTPGRASVLCDGSFGSTGKGLAAAWLARCTDRPVDVATTNSGANSGHTTRYKNGNSFICYTLPTTGVIRGDECLIYINAGSIIDPYVFRGEINDCGVDPKHLVVDPRASIITDHMKATERVPANGPARIASTMKGVGAAIADKVMRRAPLVQGSRDALPNWLRVERMDLNQTLYQGGAVVVEVPQGLDLSLNQGLAYPYVTSRDVTVGAGLSDAGIHPSFLGSVCMVVRSFPIRVGHAYNEEGELLGESGPFYSDSEELDWGRDFPGIEPERTTVTRRIRRIATWSSEQYARGLSINRPTLVMCNFANYLSSADVFCNWTCSMRRIERMVLGEEISKVFGFGPCVEDITDDYDRAVAWFDRRSF